jgi:dihydropyrimidine dehydrogenase (NADP+)
MCGCKSKLPKLKGRVVVLGAGDTAFDCATSSFRCGATRVFVAFRRYLIKLNEIWINYYYYLLHLEGI